MTVMEAVAHHGDVVVPSASGCLCGMVEECGVVVGGDCRSIGCDPCCPVCTGPDDECPDPASCGGYSARNVVPVMVRPSNASV